MIEITWTVTSWSPPYEVDIQVELKLFCEAKDDNEKLYLIDCFADGEFDL